MAGSIDSPSVRQLPRRLIGGAAVLACLGIAALAIDVPVATWMRTHRPPREITRLLNFSEAFAHGTGVAVFLIAVVAIDPSLRPGGRAGGRDWSNFVRMVSAAYAGGIAANVIKAMVARVRPRAADFVDLPGVMATFGDGALALADPGSSDLASFPSGHAATAAGLAAALAWRYPHGGWFFAAIAALSGLQRIVASAHYPSDVCCGAALGLLMAAACLSVIPRSRPRSGSGMASGMTSGMD
ncbi:MAG: phosphatase PAP2 family protein [Planctomycetia bacterium]|jgi:membrane-associated phospholipid phosphatase